MARENDERSAGGFAPFSYFARNKHVFCTQEKEMIGRMPLVCVNGNTRENDSHAAGTGCQFGMG